MSGELRMSFVLLRDDIPLLFDDLQRFPKGTRRINRLRLLAYAGLSAMQSPVGAPSRAAMVKPEESASMATPLGVASVEFFSLPLK